MTNNEEVIATKNLWEPLCQMPERRVEMTLSIKLSSSQAKRVRQGFIPAAMEDKWFSYYEDGILYQHRSWTGYCIDKIYFEETTDGGLIATRAEVNRDAAQYANSDDGEDKQRIEKMVIELANLPLGAKSSTVDSMMVAFQNAMQPNYLGSPSVMDEVVFPFYEACINEWVGNNFPILVENVSLDGARRILLNILRGRDQNYGVIGTWHSMAELGQAVIKYFDLDAEYCRDESLGFVLTEGLLAVQEKIFSLLDEYVEECYREEREFPEIEKLIELLSPIKQLMVTVFMGSNVVLMPNVTLNDATWGDS